MENNETKVLVEEVLDKVRPYLQRDGGDIELLGIQDGVEALILEYVPGIIEVVNVA